MGRLMALVVRRSILLCLGKTDGKWASSSWPGCSWLGRSSEIGSGPSGVANGSSDGG